MSRYSFLKQVKYFACAALCFTLSLQAELLVVDSTLDDSAVDANVSAITAGGKITLRSALERADANGDMSNTINFAIPQADPGYLPGTDHWQIVPQSDLPAVFAKQIIIDGYTQVLGASPATPNSNPIDQGNNAQLKIELRGPGAGVNLPVIDGIDFILADNSVVKGLIINNYAGFFPDLQDPGNSFPGAGIFSFGTSNLTIEGCFFGVDVTGTQSLPNIGAITLIADIESVIGGSTPASRNLLSGSYTDFNGVVGIFGATDVQVSHNTFGLDRAGTSVLTGFDSRMNIFDASDGTVIGGPTSSYRNVLAGGSAFNVFADFFATNLQILNNYIGLDVTGSKGFDENGNGIVLIETVGATIASNVISGNSRGILLGQNAFNIPTNKETLVVGNIIGLTPSGDQPIGNVQDGIYLNFAEDTLISNNVISANGANGVRTGKARRTTIINNLIGTDALGTAVFGNARNGIQLGSLVAAGIPSEDDVVTGNTIAGNGLNGISIQNCAMGAIVSDNNIGASITGDDLNRPNAESFGNCGCGVLLLAGATNNTIDDNIIEYNKEHGVTFKYDANNNVVSSNSIHDNKGDGVHVCDSSCNLIGGSNSDDACFQICELENGNYIFDNCGYGVIVAESTCGSAIENTIISNKIVDNRDGRIKLACKDESSSCSSSSSSSSCSSKSSSHYRHHNMKKSKR